MGDNALLYLHVLAAMTLVGAVLCATVASAASTRVGEGSEALRRLAAHTALIGALATGVTLVLGEAIQLRDDVHGRWLDGSSDLAYAGVLLPVVVLVVLGYLSLSRPRLAGWAAALGLVAVAVSLAVVFLMAAQPS